MLFSIREKFFQYVDIKQAESKKVYWSIFLAIFSGCLRCLISSFPMAFFLSIYGSDYLPNIYLVVAGLYFVIGVIYGFFEYHVSFNKLILGFLFLLAFVQSALALGNLITDQEWIIMGLVAWASLTFNLLDMVIWSILNRIYTLQQAKSSFGVIGGLQSMGGVLGGLITPVLVLYFSLKALILSLGILIFVIMIIIFLMLNSLKINHEIAGHDDPLETVNSDGTFTIKSIVQNPYILKIFTLVTLSLFSMYTIDLMFNSAANAHYPSEAALAGFLGLFYGVVDGLTFFGGIFLFTWFLKRIGLIGTLTVLPILSILLITPLLFILKIPSYFYYIFWFILSLKLIEEGLRPALFDKCVLLLWQPFHPKMRSFLMSKNASIITGLAAATISLVLIFTTSYVGISIGLFAGFTVVFYVLIVMLLLPLKKDYVKALTQAITHRYYEFDSSLTLSFEDLTLLKKYLESSFPDEVIYALKTIEKIDQHEFEVSLRTVFSSINSQLLNFALDKVKQYNLINYFPEIIKIYLENSNDSIQAKALEIAAALNYSATMQYLQLDSNSPALLTSSLLIHYQYSHSVESQNLVLNSIEVMSKSADEYIRSKAAYLIGILLNKSSYHVLHSLVNDPSDYVRQCAIETVIKTHYQPLYETVVDNILLLTTHDEIHTELAKDSLIFLQIINNKFATYSEAVKAKVIYFLGPIKHPEIQSFVQDLCFSESLTTQQLALDALANIGTNYDVYFSQKIHDEILLEGSNLEQYYLDLVSIPRLAITELLRSIIERKLFLSHQRLFSCLAIYYEKTIIEKAKNGLSTDKENEQSYALELLDSTLTSSHKKILLPILKKFHLQERPVNDDLHTPRFYQVLKSNFDIKQGDPLTILGCAASLYVIIRGSITGFSDEINRVKSLGNSLLDETLTWLQAPS